MNPPAVSLEKMLHVHYGLSILMFMRLMEVLRDHPDELGEAGFGFGFPFGFPFG